jgi:dipeptidyl aminopeptidase/acylaminoacyl peptidase
MQGIHRSLLVALVLGVAHAAGPPPPEAYGRLPAIGSAAISPDGKRLALQIGYEFQSAEPERELTAFRVLNIDSGAFEQTLTPPAGNTLRGAGWADEGRPYYFVSVTGFQRDALPASWPITMRGGRVEFWRTAVVSLATNKGTVLMSDPEHRGNFSLTALIAPIEGDPGYARMIAWGGVSTMNSMPGLAVWRVNLDTGKATPIFDGSMQTRGFLVDQRGRPIARVDVDEAKDRWKLIVYDGEKNRVLLDEQSESGQPLQMFGLLPDGRLAAVNQHEDGERDTLLAIDLQTGKQTPLHTTAGSDVRTVHDWSHRVVGLRWTDDLPKQHFLDAKLQAIYDALQPKFADGYVLLQSWSRDLGRVLLFGEHADDAGAYYVYEPATQRLRSVGKLYPALQGAQTLGDRRSIKYRSRDGTSIPAYLTLPANVEPKNLPLVLLVHGGPHARDDFTFDWWASFLASRGYVVLQANYRGSTGYGYDWFNAGRGGWGDGVMQTDVEDGADALVKAGMVDARRICIMGASYGGYAALAGATVTPDRYACAVSVNGVSDPERMLSDAKGSYLGKRGMAAEWWSKSMGDAKHLHTVSPKAQAAKARAPILIIHGTEDTVVPVEQSRRMTATLKAAGKNVTYVELKGDDHWLSSASMRTQMLQEVEKILASALGGAAVDATRTASRQEGGSTR